MMQVLDKIYSTHDWRPRRSLIFCVSLLSLDVCPQILPDFLRRKIVAYVGIHDYSLRGSFEFPYIPYVAKELFTRKYI